MIRLPESMSRERKSKRIQEVVDLLELNKCIGTSAFSSYLKSIYHPATSKDRTRVTRLANIVHHILPKQTSRVPPFFTNEN